MGHPPLPPNNKGSPYNKANWGSGGPMAPVNMNTGSGILRLLLNQGPAQFRFQENRKGKVLGLSVERPGLEI